MPELSAGPARGSANTKPFKVSINGVEVEGRAYYSSYDITVEITKPFVNLVASSHIMVMARGVYTFDGELANQRAKELLTHLYWIGGFIDREFEELKSTFAEHLRQASDVPRGEFSSNEMRERHRVLRERFRKGKTSNSDYQLRIGQLRRNAEDLKLRKWQSEDQFFESNFPMPMGNVTQNSVAKILQGNQLVSNR